MPTSIMPVQTSAASTTTLIDFSTPPQQSATPPSASASPSQRPQSNMPASTSTTTTPPPTPLAQSHNDTDNASTQPMTSTSAKASPNASATASHRQRFKQSDTPSPLLHHRPASPSAMSVASIIRRQRPTTTSMHQRTTSTSTSSSSTLSTSPSATQKRGIAMADDANLRNNHISIVSLDDEDDDDDGNCSSSLADSDSDLDNLSVNLSELVAASMRQQSTSATVGGGGGAQSSGLRSNGMIVINKGQPAEVMRADDGVVGGGGGGGSQRPHIGSIALQNSTDITFGDKTFYQGPVTVKQFFLEKDQWRRQESNTTTRSAAGGSSHTAAGTVPTADGVGGLTNGAFVSSSSGEEDELGGRGRRTKDEENQHTQGRGGPSPTAAAAAEPTKLERLFCWQKLVRLERRPLVLSILITLILLFMAMVAFVTYLLLVPTTLAAHDNDLGDGDDSRYNGPSNASQANNLLDTEFGTSMRFIPRVLWLAQPAKTRLTDLELPANRVIIAHTASGPCQTQAACTLSVRIIQTFHMDSMNWDDIGYNFLVGGDGAVYEGRGWDKEGAHTRGFNKKSICIAFIGTFITAVPPPRQLHAARILIEEGLLTHKLSADYRLYGHRQLMASESPGDELYHIIQKWPHWTNTSNSSTTGARETTT